MPSPLSGLVNANFPTDVLYNAGVVFAGSTRLGVTKGPPKFTTNRTWQNIDFDGKYAPGTGLDRAMNGEPSLAFSMLEIGPAATGNQILKFEPGSALATTTAPATPGTLTATGAITGGTLTAGTYYYKWTAVNAGGESLASAEASGIVASGVSGSVALSGVAVATATAYRWYRGTGAGLENVYYQTATNAYTDTGAASTLGAPPAGGSGSTTTYTPLAAGGLLVLANYITDLRVLWERAADGSGNYFAVYLPYALCTKYDIAGQDTKEALISVEFAGRINVATQPLTDSAYRLEFRNSLP